jgi:hypothetical protein
MTGFFYNIGSAPSYLVSIGMLFPHKYVFEALVASEFSGAKLIFNARAQKVFINIP